MSNSDMSTRTGEGIAAAAPVRDKKPQSARKNQHVFSRYYYDRPGFVDGRTRFLRMCDSFVGNETILEIGAGPKNKTTAHFAARVPVIGLDVSEEVRENHWLTEAHVYNGERFPFPDDSFQLCVSDYVLEHVSNPQEHFQEIRRVLKPGGVFCFRTPNLWHYFTLGSRLMPHTLHLRLANWLRDLGSHAGDPYPTVYKANSRRAVRRFAKAAGLEVFKLETIEPEPSYGRASLALFYPMMAYERLVNSSPRLAAFRDNLLGALRKPVSVAGSSANCS
jgi:SAM-dependent methyltransferase